MHSAVRARRSTAVQLCALCSAAPSPPLSHHRLLPAPSALAGWVAGWLPLPAVDALLAAAGSTTERAAAGGAARGVSSAASTCPRTGRVAGRCRFGGRSRAEEAHCHHTLATYVGRRLYDQGAMHLLPSCRPTAAPICGCQYERASMRSPPAQGTHCVRKLKHPEIWRSTLTITITLRDQPTRTGLSLSRAASR